MQSVINDINNSEINVIVVLSQSDWYSERESASYEYIVRLAEYSRVYFVQKFNPEENQFVTGKIGNVTIVNPIHGYTLESMELILSLVNQKGNNNLLFWVYNPYYIDALKLIAVNYILLYHALNSEELCKNIQNKNVGNHFNNSLKDTINFACGVLTNSVKTLKAIEAEITITTPGLYVNSEIDFEFWSNSNTTHVRENAVLCWGNIDDKINFNLLNTLINSNKNIVFWFVGKIDIIDEKDRDLWAKIILNKNVIFYGEKSSEFIRELIYKAKITLIPLKENSAYSENVFSINALRCLISGMIVLSTKVNQLERYQKYIHFISENDSIQSLMKIEVEDLKERREFCRSQSLDYEVNSVVKIISNLEIRPNLNRTFKKKILLLYARSSCHVNTIREHVDAFGLFSKHSVTYYNATVGNKLEQEFLSSFETVVVHYSLRISESNHMSDDIRNKLSKFNGLKILFIQDEYDTLNITYQNMSYIKFNVVFTCVPKKYIDYVYPKEKFSDVEFVQNLTGYVPFKLSNFQLPQTKFRKIHTFYRGRKLPIFYGTLGLEKYEIGERFKEYARKYKKDLKLDIYSDEEKRLYGDSWYGTLLNSKTTLGTESGSNVFDFKGNLKEEFEKALKSGRSEEDIYENEICLLEKNIKMNQISPKMFEAIALKTVLILYEGTYSDILIPYRHYIPLKKDFSNFDEVISYIENDLMLQHIADVAYYEIVKNDKYSYQYFIQNKFDKIVDDLVSVLKPSQIISDSSFCVAKSITLNSNNFKYLKKYNEGFVKPSFTSQEYEQTLHQSDSPAFDSVLTNIKLATVAFLRVFTPKVSQGILEFMIRIKRIVNKSYKLFRRGLSKLNFIFLTASKEK